MFSGETEIRDLFAHWGTPREGFIRKQYEEDLSQFKPLSTSRSQRAGRGREDTTRISFRNQKGLRRWIYYLKIIYHEWGYISLKIEDPNENEEATDKFLSSLEVQDVPEPGSNVNIIMYVGFCLSAAGVCITSVGLGDKGFRTTELRLFGPSLVVLGVVFVLGESQFISNRWWSSFRFAIDSCCYKFSYR